LKRYSRNLLIVFFLTSIAVIPVMFWLHDQGFFLIPEEAPDDYLVAISFYNGFALAGLVVMVRFIKMGRPFLKRMYFLLLALLIATVIRIYIADIDPDIAFVIGSALWEPVRAFCAAFAVAYMAHATMVRYMPATLLRVKDITPLLVEGQLKGQHPKRRIHAIRSRWVFDMGSRSYLDTTKLRLETQNVRTFSWYDWGLVSVWASIGLLALSIYIEAYPRVEERIDMVFTAVISAHLLCMVPILVLPVLPMKSLGPRIPVGDREFSLAAGFSENITRWMKIAFFPIIAVGLLFRVMPWENIVELMQALMITIPTALITCMVYIECFRERTVAEVQRSIKEREEVEAGSYGSEPWRETSLLDGVEIVEADFYLE